MNLRGTHLSAGERRNMMATKLRFQTCSEAEIEAERDYLDTMRTIRGLAEEDNQNA